MFIIPKFCSEYDLCLLLQTKIWILSYFFRQKVYDSEWKCPIFQKVVKIILYLLLKPLNFPI